MKYKATLILASVCLFLFVGCGKDLTSEVIGTWNVQTFDTKPQGTLTITFDNQSNLTRIANDGTELDIDSCKYEIQESLTKKNLIISDSKMINGYGDLNGKYRIDKLKNNILVMTRIELEDEKTAGAYMRLEMIKNY